MWMETADDNLRRCCCGNEMLSRLVSWLLIHSSPDHTAPRDAGRSSMAIITRSNKHLYWICSNDSRRQFINGLLSKMDIFCYVMHYELTIPLGNHTGRKAISSL